MSKKHLNGIIILLLELSAVTGYFLLAIPRNTNTIMALFSLLLMFLVVGLSINVLLDNHEGQNVVFKNSAVFSALLLYSVVVISTIMMATAMTWNWESLVFSQVVINLVYFMVFVVIRKTAQAINQNDAQSYRQKMGKRGKF